MIAEVIVDVPAKQTDRPFDYVIPQSLETVIQIGMRVVVPFGPRRIQGFVIGIKSQSTLNKLKKIIEPLDLTPVLSESLISLGNWLSEETLSYRISAYQAMLPAALKAKYQKKLQVSTESKHLLPQTLQGLFTTQDSILWEEAKETGYLSLLQQEVTKGHILIIYEVKDKIKKKKRLAIRSALSTEELKTYQSSLTPRAQKQHDVIKYFIANNDWIFLTDLTATLQISNAVVKELVKKEVLEESEREIYRDPYENRYFARTEPLLLTNEQQEAIDPIHDRIAKSLHEVFLLYGVTGSGKTEVYLQSIQRVLGRDQEAICLVPEISLTPQMVHRFKGRFGNQVAVMHSGLSAGEKYDEWRKVQRGEVKVVVGARSAVFAPFENLGLIIIDEEHETSYKQEENPKYHAKDVAIKRGKQGSFPVILGSATPSLESFARAKKGVYTLLSLPKRMNNQDLPQVDIVDMREELRSGNRSMFSSSLLEKLQLRLEKKEQTVLFLNKRGYSSFVMCRDCGYVVNCPNCDISLTYHRHQQQMKCHYCGYEDHVPSVCPECQSDHIRYFGTGTQKVEEELHKVLPEARVIRMDVDTTSKKGSHERLLNEFQKGHADILLGTQMIAKGLDFPNITLVGVLSADTMLHLPDFRSSEKTFQLLTQVSGRAGRHQLPGEVVIQTYSPEHYSIELAAEQNYDQFYEREMMIRKGLKYPPFYFITLITVSHEQLMKALDVTEKITTFLTSRLTKSAICLGPVASPIPRINNRYRYQCLIKYKREPELNQSLKKILDQYQQEVTSTSLKISVDVNPFILM